MIVAVGGDGTIHEVMNGVTLIRHVKWDLSQLDQEMTL